MGTINYELASTILVEAAFFGNKATAEKHGITDRTIRNYRRRMETDRILSALFQEKRLAFERDWAAELPSAIRSTIAFLQGAAQQANKSDPLVIHAIAGAMKLLVDVAMTKEVLDARLAGQRGQAGATPNPMATAVRNVNNN